MTTIEKKNLRVSTLFLLAGYAIFGFSFLFSKKALFYTSPMVLMGFRFTSAFLILNIVIVFKKVKIKLKGKQLIYIFMLGLVQPVLYFICETYGVKLLQTSFVGILLSLIPMTSFLVGYLFLKERVKLIQILFALLSVVGVVFTTLGQTEGQFSWLGFLLIIGSVITASLFNVLSRKLANEYTAFERTYAMFFIGFVTFLVLGLIDSIGNFRELVIIPMGNLSFWISIIFLSGISSVGAFLMVNYAMTYFPVAKASIFSNIATVISILVGVIFLHEHFGVYQLIGSIIIIGSVYGVNKRSKRNLVSNDFPIIST